MLIKIQTIANLSGILSFVLVNAEDVTNVQPVTVAIGAYDKEGVAKYAETAVTQFQSHGIWFYTPWTPEVLCQAIGIQIADSFFDSVQPLGTTL